MIFSRNGGSGGRHAADDPRRSGRHSHQTGDDSVYEADGYAGDDQDTESPQRGRNANRTGAQRRQAPVALDGPYDIEDAPTGVTRVDLGSLQIPSIDGVEVRVQANAGGIIQQVVLGHGGSALQLGVFAAPRSEGIWDEVRAEIRKSLFDDGVAVEEVRGDYGAELRARVRSAEGMMDIRFIGVDGPRWMLRAVYQGPAAVDPSSSVPLTTCLRGLVVDRGRDAMPVREALPLRLPREIADAAKANAAAASEQVADTGTHHREPVAPATNGTHLNGSTGNVYGRGMSQPQIPEDYNGNGEGINFRGSAAAPAVGDAPRNDASRRRPSPRPRRSE